jgi:hypothetical protein
MESSRLATISVSIISALPREVIGIEDDFSFFPFPHTYDPLSSFWMISTQLIQPFQPAANMNRGNYLSRCPLVMKKYISTHLSIKWGGSQRSATVAKS